MLVTVLVFCCDLYIKHSSLEVFSTANETRDEIGHFSLTSTSTP